MSAHLELDFNDDGTITLTHRTEKDGELKRSTTTCPMSDDVILEQPFDSCGINVAAGEDLTVTHFIVIGTPQKMLQLMRVANLELPDSVTAKGGDPGKPRL